jgi:hypothetical protein
LYDNTHDVTSLAAIQRVREVFETLNGFPAEFHKNITGFQPGLSRRTVGMDVVEQDAFDFASETWNGPEIYLISTS